MGVGIILLLTVRRQEMAGSLGVILQTIKRQQVWFTPSVQNNKGPISGPLFFNLRLDRFELVQLFLRHICWP